MKYMLKLLSNFEFLYICFTNTTYKNIIDLSIQRGGFILKKTISILLAMIIAVSCVFVGCTNGKNGEDKTTTENGLEANADEYILDEIEVTDEKGEKVTDKDGNVVTTEVAYKQIIDKKGNKIVVELDENGEPKKDKKGNYVTVKYTTTKATTKKVTTTKATTTAKPTTMKHNSNEKPTEKEPVSVAPENDKVPESSKDKFVNFSANDQQIVKAMLEVPYLYLKSYKAGDPVPTEIASHVAIWMAEREGLNTDVYASGTIVLDLFKYFGQTVVNYKSNCKTANNGGAPITYNSNNDTFSIANFEGKKQTVSLQSIKEMGNNYYEVTASVKGADGKSKVVAVIQKNKLDSTLGFSIKQLQWS